mgnify:CR=1 FL=1
MKTNWLAVTNRVNKERYKIPAGWETKEQVAESLQCDPSRVHDLLKAAITAGEVERQEFPTWDDNRRCTVRVACYRVAGSKPQAETKRNPSLEDKVRTSILRFPSYSDSRIADSFKGLRAADVARIRKTIAN